MTGKRLILISERETYLIEGSTAASSQGSGHSAAGFVSCSDVGGCFFPPLSDRLDLAAWDVLMNHVAGIELSYLRNGADLHCCFSAAVTP